MKMLKIPPCGTGRNPTEVSIQCIFSMKYDSSTIILILMAGCRQGCTPRQMFRNTDSLTMHGHTLLVILFLSALIIISKVVDQSV